MGNDIDINYCVDFERTLERLQHAAGKIFRQYREAKLGSVSEEEIKRLRLTYIEAQDEAEAPSQRDEAGRIQAVLVQRV